MPVRATIRRLSLLALLTIAYVVTGKFGLRLGIVSPSASAVWAPTGIALAACILAGTSVWPAILLGAFFVNFTTTGDLVTSLGIATGNTLEAVIGAWLVARWARGRRAFETGATAIRYAILTALGATMVSATFGVTALALKGLARWSAYRDIWFTWWLGDAAGALILAPPLILWVSEWRLHWSRRRWIEATALALSLVAVSFFSFGGLTEDVTGGHSLGFLVVPILIWAAVRFEPRIAATAVAIVAAIAVTEMIRSGAPRNTELVLLQSFLTVTDVMILVLASTVTERNGIEAQLRQLAVTDPLTGLANYRQLITAIETEIKRSSRSERPFALLLFDLDRLKRVNDRHGHLVGSRALCRLADSMRQSSRTIDTPARLGGDEFALVLPETSVDNARQVAERIRKRLATDQEHPAVSASSGVSLYPDDGTTIEALLGAADRALYKMKAETD